MAQLGLSNIRNTIKPVLTNLLTNSQWMAMTGSTLENVGSNLITGFTNDGLATCTTSGSSITSAISTGSGQGANSNVATVVKGKLYKYTITATVTGGNAPSVQLKSGDGSVLVAIANGLLTTGVPFVHVFEELTGGSLAIIQQYDQAAGASTWSSTNTLYEVTPGYVAANGLAPDLGLPVFNLNLVQ